MKIVAILGSPSVSSRSSSLLQLSLSRLLASLPVHLSASADNVQRVSLRDLPGQALLQAEFAHPEIQHALQQVAQAQVVLIATPIYKAAYSGLLKVFLDLLPQDGLRDKTVLPLATGGSLAHLLALDYALKPVLSALGARDILDPVFAIDAQIPKHDVLGYAPSADVEERIDRTLKVLVQRAEDIQRAEDAAQEREALLARLQARTQAADATDTHEASDSPWATHLVRWSV